MEKKIIGISLGDPAGIGAEVLLKGFPQLSKTSGATPLVIGDIAVVEKNLVYGKASVNIVQRKSEMKQGYLNIYNTGVIKDKDFPIGKDSSLCGKASFLYVEKAMQLWKEREIDGLVTLPISKKAWHMAGLRYSGHTELLAERLGSKRFAMVMIAGNIRALLATTHIPLKEVSGKLSEELLAEKILIGYEFLQKIGIEHPVIGVSALNPHGGEGGVLGDEEEDVIEPVVKRMKGEGINCKGPFPADAIFSKAVEGQLDMIIAIYHDQAMIPLKAFYFDELVNCTAGMEMARTSPGHGTAFDIAYKGVATSSPFIEAYKLVAELISS
jgi:4-hydroxythreonine-4-phosphate dehydrogenase